MTLSHKKWILWFLVILFLPVTVMALVNYIVDPLWCFSHENRYNAKQLALIEREQKTNYLTYRCSPYDALLIGNSRFMLINQTDFNGLSVFNYAASAMIVREYEGYIGYARKVTANQIKTIFLGLSFSSVNGLTAGITNESNPAYYIDKATAPLNRLRTILNPSVLKFSWRTLKLNLANDTKAHLIFDRHNVARDNELNRSNREKNFTKDLDQYRNIYTSAFRPDAGFKAHLSALKEQTPGVRIVAFTTPVSKPMHCLLSETGLIPEYEQWIRDIVEVFGELHHFEYVHSIADNYKENFIDANHFIPQIGTFMAHKLQGKNAGVPDDFGIIINRDNLEHQLDFLRDNFKACR